MSDGLIMKGSPPSSGRRASAKQRQNVKKAAVRAASSSAAASGKSRVKAVGSARTGTVTVKRNIKAAASAGPSASAKIASKTAKQANGRSAKAASAKPKSSKFPGVKKNLGKAVVSKAPKSPVKAGAAKSKKPDARATSVKQAAVDAKSGVKMKGNSTPDKTVKPGAAGADHQAAGATVVLAKPQTPPVKIVVPENYRPTEAEPLMNPLQRHYFRLKLLNWKEEILRQTRETLQGMHDETVQYADLADRATSETDRALELRARDRQRKLISKIDAALARIEDGTYGYCEETGEPIGLKRLDARPIATLSLEAQERHERRERVHRGD